VRQVTYYAAVLLQGPLGGLFATLPFMLAAASMQLSWRASFR